MRDSRTCRFRFLIEVAPIWREYERGSTAIADGYVKPIMQRYVEEAIVAFADAGLEAPWALMKSNGGKTPADAAEAEPIKFLLSGLAGGIIAGHYFGQLAGASNLVTLDMGGTSCDVGLVRDGKISHSNNFEIEWGLPVATPTIDLTTIGAGGGRSPGSTRGDSCASDPQSAGRRSRPGLLRHRRRERHCHRRQPRPRPAQPRVFPRRRRFS